jgi:tungstate transport system ATP-binding protein
LEPLLEVRNLSRTVSVKEIFNVEHFSLIRGEHTALVGPNGAGKTTFLLTMALLLPPSSGTISLNGETASGHNLLALRRRMAVVFQDALLLDMSVTSNLRAALSIRGVQGREARARSEKWLDLFGISHLAGRQARRLSGGEAQRASLARAFALEPDILFLDEPFAALDYPTRNSLLKDLRQLLEHMDVTVVFVTHDYSEIPFLAARTAVMHNGRIMKQGSNEEIFGIEFLQRLSFVPWEE